MNKEQEEQIVKLVEERFGLKAQPVGKSRCCVEDPPDSSREVKIVGDRLSITDIFTAWWDTVGNEWVLCSCDTPGALYGVGVPRSAMVGKRWVEKE